MIEIITFINKNENLFKHKQNIYVLTHKKILSKFH